MSAFVARAVRVLAAVSFFASVPALAASCPTVGPPIRCFTFDAPLSTDAAGPPPANGVELVYLYLPGCPHCSELELEFRGWSARLPPQVTVNRQVVVWSMPKKLTIYDPRVADAAFESLGEREYRTLQPRFYEHAIRKGWLRQDAEAFLASVGKSVADAERLAQSEKTKAILQRRVALVTATRATQVPYVIVARRNAVTVEVNGQDWKAERFVGALETLLGANGVKLQPAAAGAAPAANSPATPAPSPGAYVPRPMPMPADFLPVPANAATMPPHKCVSGDVRTQPKDLREKDEMARRMLSQLRMWGEKHYRFEGCKDYGFIISQWQAMVGMPQTGVLDAAVVKSVLDAALKIQPQLLAAQKQWSDERAAARSAGLDPNTGVPPTAEERERWRRSEEARAARMAPAAAPTSPANFVRPAPVGPAEQQVFGFSLGQPFAPQLPLCPWRSGWTDGVDFTHTCQYRLGRIGRNSANWVTPLEAELFSEFISKPEDVPPEPDGLVAISFATDERPGLLARAGIRGLLVEGRLEGIGFVPSDRDAVIEAFTSRFGPPIPMPVSMQNDSGAKWVGQRYEFRRNDVTATLNCVEFGTKRCSFAEVLTSRGRSALDEWRRKDAKRGVQF